MPNKQRVAFFEFSVFQGVFPLASGYLESAARLDPLVRDTFEFEKHSVRVNSPGSAEVVDKVDADVYAFSCYVWNMGLVRRILPRLLARRPNAQVLLGGPQVMHKAERYLKPEHENLVLCNGEGEYTFAAYLAQLASGSTDFSEVKGLSFFRGGELVTTPKQDRVHDLDQVPSPYLGGLLEPEGKYVWALIETNRGCPFKCTYCYWGAATNAKVHKYGIDRVLDELTWLSEQGVLYLFIADANFGMLKRDVEIARHLAECKRKNGYPMTVYFSSSKNTPERVTEITTIFDQAGMVATQPVSLQTMSAQTLEHVKRSNIRESSYMALQQLLNKNQLSSYIELIWPLPGETLESYKEGVGQLCRLGADSLIMYPLLLINNVEMDQQREEFELKTVADSDPNSEAEIVIGTKYVDYETYLEGLRFSFHATCLYGVRGLRYVGHYLDSSETLSYAELISGFQEYCKRFPENPYVDYIESTLAASEQYKFNAMGGVLHKILHDARPAFDDLLSGYLRSLDCWQDEKVRFLFELDLLAKPYIYRNTPMADVGGKLEMIQMLSQQKNSVVVRMPPEYYDLAKQKVGFQNGTGNPSLKIQYIASQFPFMKAKSLDDNYAYCNDKLHKMGSILPTWTAC